MIEHLVISGGAIVGFSFYGILHTLIMQDHLNMDDIRTIHATSVGTVLAVMITLGYDLNVIKTYLLDRPWKEVWKMNFNSIVRAIKDGGMFDRTTILQTIEPLLLGKDLSSDITLEEFYAFNKKEIHFYTTEYSKLELVDISYKTHPTWKVVDAIFASSSVPGLCIPFFHDDTYYIDGATVMNYPLQCCLDEGHDREKILGLNIAWKEGGNEDSLRKPFTTPTSSYKLFEYVISIFMKLWYLVRHEMTEDEKNVPHQITVICPSDPLAIFNAMETKEERLRLWGLGETAAVSYIEKCQTISSMNFSSE